jgi:hypothetical protein
MKYSAIAKRQRRKEFIGKDLPLILALIGMVSLYAFFLFSSY